MDCLSRPPHDHHTHSHPPLSDRGVYDKDSEESITEEEAMSQKTKCTRCDKTFPDHLMQSLFTSGKGYESMCPICALAQMNEVHGMNRTEFSGEMANQLLYEARGLLKKTPKNFNKAGRIKENG